MRSLLSKARFTLLCLAPLACNPLTAPNDERVTPMADPTPPVQPATAQPAPTPAPAPPPPPAPTPAPEEKVRASHILVAWKGAMRADPQITRTKIEARKLAETLLKRAQKEKFEDLAKKYSDDKGSGAQGGNLGAFARTQMVKPFADAAFALKPGQLSAIVESDFGFHVIKRAAN